MGELEQVAWFVQLQSVEKPLFRVLSQAVKCEVMLCLSYVHKLIKRVTRDSFYMQQWKYTTQKTTAFHWNTGRM